MNALSYEIRACSLRRIKHVIHVSTKSNSKEVVKCQLFFEVRHLNVQVDLEKKRFIGNTNSPPPPPFFHCHVHFVFASL
jgi:hypothetical protein